MGRRGAAGATRPTSQVQEAHGGDEVVRAGATRSTSQVQAAHGGDEEARHRAAGPPGPPAKCRRHTGAKRRRGTGQGTAGETHTLLLAAQGPAQRGECARCGRGTPRPPLGQAEEAEGASPVRQCGRAQCSVWGPRRGGETGSPVPPPLNQNQLGEEGGGGGRRVAGASGPVHPSTPSGVRKGGHGGAPPSRPPPTTKVRRRVGGWVGGRQPADQPPPSRRCSGAAESKVMVQLPW